MLCLFCVALYVLLRLFCCLLVTAVWVVVYYLFCLLSWFGESVVLVVCFAFVLDIVASFVCVVRCVWCLRFCFVLTSGFMCACVVGFGAGFVGLFYLFRAVFFVGFTLLTYCFVYLWFLL